MTTTQAQSIAAIIAPALEHMGYEIVRVHVGGGKSRPTLQIMLDRIDGRIIQLEDCEKSSRHISALLDVEDPISSAYVLEVSSAGIDRPLTRLKDFMNWQGFDARIETNELIDGRRRFKGVLGALSNNNIQITDDGKSYTILFAAIHRAQLILTDALIEEAEKRAKALQPDFDMSAPIEILDDEDPEINEPANMNGDR